MLNVSTLPPGLSVPRHGTWIASPVTLPSGVAVRRRQRASMSEPFCSTPRLRGSVGGINSNGG
eukprot:95183-Prymnesium_polylepis.1